MLCFSWWWCLILIFSWWWCHSCASPGDQMAGDDVVEWRQISDVPVWLTSTSARWACSHCPQYSPAPPPAPGCPDQCFIIRKGVAQVCLQHHDVIMMLVVMVSITMVWWWWCWKYLMWWWCCRWRWCFPSSWWCVKAGADDGDVMLELFEGRWAAHWSPETSYCWSPWWRFIYFSRSVLFY